MVSKAFATNCAMLAGFLVLLLVLSPSTLLVNRRTAPQNLVARGLEFIPPNSSNAYPFDLTLSALLFHNSSSYFEDDCASQYVRKMVSVVISPPIDRSFPPYSTLSSLLDRLRVLLRSLHLTVELRTASRLIFDCGLSSDGDLRSTIESLANQDPFFLHTSVFHCPSSIVSGTFGSILNYLSSALTTDYVWVLPIDQPLTVSFHVFDFIRTMEKRPQVVLSRFHSFIHHFENISENGSAFILASHQMEGKALCLDLPSSPSKYIHKSMGWLAYNRQGFGFSDRERNKYAKILTCPSNGSQSHGPSRGPFWLCNQVNPLMFSDPQAYMAHDCVSDYLAKRLTIVLTAHVVPSSPSLYLIQVFMQSLHLMPELRHCPKLIVFDGARPATEALLKESIENVQRQIDRTDGEVLYRNTQVFRVEGEPGHLRKTTEAAILKVKTPFSYIVQPDLPVTQASDMLQVIRSVEMSPNLQYIRFMRSHVGPNKFDLAVDHRIPPMTTIPLVRTTAFSSENHLVTTVLYPEIIFPMLAHSRFTGYAKHCISMECLINHRRSHKRPFQTYLYGKHGDGPFTAHLDGTERHSPIPKEDLLEF